MTYINMKLYSEVETVDEFETVEEARLMLKEYILADSYSNYYLSQRCTNNWRGR